MTALELSVDAVVRFRFKNLMKRTGEPTVEVLMARIAALQAENRQLSDRVVKLEEELALARLHRFAPRSEKHVDRLFNEAEQVADEDDGGSEDGDVVDLPDTGLPPVKKTRQEARPQTSSGKFAA